MTEKSLWNGVAGRNWVDGQALTDRMLQPFEDLLVAAVPPGARVLDVGCGTGATTVAIARALGGEGGCTGVDISEPMVTAARERAAREGVPVEFVLADAAGHAFTGAAYDLVVSRFGVMFFDDPVRAFTNLRHATSPGGALRLIVWRDAAQNPFMTAAEEAAAPLMPGLSIANPDEPGRFAFADPAKVHALLGAAGWAEVVLEPIDAACALPHTDLESYITRFGPLGRVLPSLDPEAAAALVPSVLTAFDKFTHGDEIRFTAAAWQITARA